MPDFLSDFFCELLGYTRPADGGARYTISREKHDQVQSPIDLDGDAFVADVKD